MSKHHENFTGPREPVDLLVALTLCQQNRLWCMRPSDLIGSGTGVAWRVKSGEITPVGEHGWISKSELFLGLWQVLPISALEREEMERETGVDL